MFERILVPLDGSERSEAVLRQIEPILRSKDATVILFRAFEPWTGYSVSWETTRAVEEKIQEDCRDYLSRIERRLRDEGVRACSLLGEAPAAESILEAARKENVTLIAMSTHGRTGLARWAYGSVAEKILRSSTVPLFLARSFGHEWKVGQLPKKILVPICAADESLEIVPVAAEFAHLFGAQALLVNVCEEHPQCAIAVPQVTHAYEEFREAGVAAEPLMRKGDPASAILEACKEHGADLIAMTTHGRSGVSRWTLGSVAEKVLRAAPVPVLVVRSHTATREKNLPEAKEAQAEAR